MSGGDLDPTSVPCPTCGADQGAPCEGLAGETWQPKVVHLARLDLAGIVKRHRPPEAPGATESDPPPGVAPRPRPH